MSWIELVAQRHPPKPPAGMQPPENARDWFRVENSADDPDATDILVYDSIGGWFGMYADEFVEALNEVKSSKINLRLNSPGGSVFEGITIANALRAHPASVTVYVDGLAASIASVIAMAGERLVMMPQSQLMVHNASAGCYGDATAMTQMADLLDKQSLNIAQAYAEYSGRPLAEWQDYMAAETWFTAEEAVAVGLADEVVPMRAPKKEAALAPAEAHVQHAWDLSAYHYAGREHAPTPVITAQAPAPGQQILAEHVRRLNAVADSITLDGIDISGDISKVTEPGYSEDAQAKIDSLPPGTITLDLNIGADQTVADLIRDLIRQEIAAALTPAQPDDSPAAPDNTSPPPFPPDEEEEEEEEKDSPPEEDEPADQADDWTSVIGLLVSPTSPSADDVFAQLKEGW